MKNNRTNVLVIFGVLAVVLATISIFSFVYTGTSSPANPSTTTSGTNSHYPNGMMGIAVVE